nr:hypothetical protein Ccrd_000414 [Ipomoea batatas]
MRALRFDDGLGSTPGLLAAERLAVLESLLPSLTFQFGPPSNTVESRAAIATISAQDTTPGHTFSIADLMTDFIVPNNMGQLLE